MEPTSYDIVNKIPNQLFFSALPDRQQVLKYINYLFSNVPESKTLNQDSLYREVISKHLRIINMKVIEPEIFLCIALTTITIDDFTSSSELLIKKVITEGTTAQEPVLSNSTVTGAFYFSEGQTKLSPKESKMAMDDIKKDIKNPQTRIPSAITVSLFILFIFFLYL